MIIFISVLVSAVSVAVMWGYMCRVSALRNGWRRLAERYGYGEPFVGERFGLQSAVLNGFAFTGTLVLGVGPAGFYLKGGFLLPLFHPPIVVPWKDLSARRLERTYSSGLALGFAAFPEMSCELADATLRRLSAEIRDDWNVEPPWSTS